MEIHTYRCVGPEVAGLGSGGPGEGSAVAPEVEGEEVGEEADEEGEEQKGRDEKAEY